jgi:hypothetical protein
MYPGARAAKVRPMIRTKPLLAAVLAALTLPAGASAATPTHVFKVDMKIGVGTKWTSHSENTVCSDWRRYLNGTGNQSADMKARSLLVTLRGKRFAFPGTPTRTTLPLPGAGKVPFIALKGRVGRYAKYELTHSGKGESVSAQHRRRAAVDEDVRVQGRQGRALRARAQGRHRAADGPDALRRSVRRRMPRRVDPRRADA